MNKNRELVFKITTGAVLAALSVVLKLAFDLWISVDFFGFPFYSIPLILSGFILGPSYAILVGFIADTIGGVLLGKYMFFFVFSSIAWGVIPSLLIKKKPQGPQLWFAIILTYMVGTLFNTLAIGIHSSFESAIKGLPFRASLIPVFGTIISISIEMIYGRIETFIFRLKEN